MVLRLVPTFHSKTFFLSTPEKSFRKKHIGVLLSPFFYAKALLTAQLLIQNARGDSAWGETILHELKESLGRQRTFQ